MGTKNVKSWGQIGGLISVSKSWSCPSDQWAFWPLYEKCADYTETQYSGLCNVICRAPQGYAPGGKCTPCEIDYYEYSFTTGNPLQTLTVKKGKAHKKPCEACCKFLDWRIF